MPDSGAWDKPLFNQTGTAIGEAIAGRHHPQELAFPGIATFNETGTPVAWFDAQHNFIIAIMESKMNPGTPQSRAVLRLNLMDAILYLVAASAMTLISFTFLLWLLF